MAKLFLVFCVGYNKRTLLYMRTGKVIVRSRTVRAPKQALLLGGCSCLITRSILSVYIVYIVRPARREAVSVFQVAQDCCYESFKVHSKRVFNVIRCHCISPFYYPAQLESLKVV